MKGLLIVLSGPSGAGKGTVLKTVFAQNDNLRSSISVTTRAPRVGEVDGVNYFFKSVDEYNAMLANNQFLEHQEVYGNLYGTPSEYVERLREQGLDVVLEIDIKGALAVKELRPDAVMIFLLPNDSKILYDRLVGRHTESDKDLAIRFQSVKDEIQQAKLYDYVVINDDVQRCANNVLNILEAEKSKVSRNIEFIENFR